MSRRACSCQKCASACHTTPGWFRPGEAERVAAFFGIEIDTFARTWCVVDYHASAPDVLALQPARVDDIAAHRMHTDDGPENETCAMWTAHGCRLPLDLRPHECAHFRHDEPETVTLRGGRRKWLTRQWRGVQQAWLKALRDGARLVPGAA